MITIKNDTSKDLIIAWGSCPDNVLVGMLTTLSKTEIELETGDFLTIGETGE